MRQLFLFMLTAALLSSLTRCQEGAAELRSYDPATLTAARHQFLLSAEPQGVEGVLDVQETYTAPRQVVLVGQIGGVANPWTPGKAAFILADPITLSEFAETGEEHVCSDPSCKFCQKQKINKLKNNNQNLKYKQEKTYKKK